MMFFKVISKIKYRCLITLLGCIALLMAGCGGKDEAIILLPSGESAAEYPELEAVEQVAETVDNNVALSTAETINRTQMVYVYVCGAVYSPGVVEIAEGSRSPAPCGRYDTGGGSLLCESGGDGDGWTEVVFSHDRGS